MGAWGTALFSDDIACDVRDEFLDLVGDGLSSKAATAKLVEGFESDLHDPFVALPFWLALAATQQKYGVLENDVKANALRIIGEGSDLERWDDVRDRKKREQVLVKLKEALESPPPKPKTIAKRYRPITPVQMGDAFAYQLRDGRFVLFRVLGVYSDKGGAYPWVELCDWIGAEVPAAAEVGQKKGTFYFSSFLGRPRGRRLASSPKRFAVRSLHAAPPKGVPRLTLRRSRVSSASVSGVWT